MGQPGHTSEYFTEHKVELSPFYISKFEITQAQWQSLVEFNPSQFKGTDLPVDNVSWELAVLFCTRLSKKTGKAYRLPTEAEWEYVCRAGSPTTFGFPDGITTETVNYDGNYPYRNLPKGSYRETTTPVGSLGRANAFGLFDLHGNVWEWCSDWHDKYKTGTVKNPRGPKSGKNRVLRGGSWYNSAEDCACYNRSRGEPFLRARNIGFRVVATLNQAEEDTNLLR